MYFQLFQLAEELKDHECTERKSKTAYLHCPKCLKVLSNSWSLQRHMKIHKDSNGVRKLKYALVQLRKNAFETTCVCTNNEKLFG